MAAFTLDVSVVKVISLSTPGENISDLMLKGQGLSGDVRVRVRSWVMLHLAKSSQRGRACMFVRVGCTLKHAEFINSLSTSVCLFNHSCFRQAALI